jgi:glycosyltransferase involved in cell wall biosynthesis
VPGRRPPVITVVAPAHNEEHYLDDSITHLVKGLRERDLDFEVLICENGSTDKTVDVARGIAAVTDEVRYLSLPEADYGRALRAGFLAAAGRLVVNFDVDLVDLGFLDRALALEGSSSSLSGALDGARDGEASVGADIVIGSKRTQGADDTRPLSRRLVTGVFTGLLRYGFGLKASDTHGIKLLRKSSTTDLVASCRSGRDIFDTELILRAEQAGRRVVEVPVRVTEQRPPRTAIASRIPRTLLGLAELRVRLWGEALGRRSGR